MLCNLAGSISNNSKQQATSNSISNNSKQQATSNNWNVLSPVGYYFSFLAKMIKMSICVEAKRLRCPSLSKRSWWICRTSSATTRFREDVAVHRDRWFFSVKKLNVFCGCTPGFKNCVLHHPSLQQHPAIHPPTHLYQRPRFLLTHRCVLQIHKERLVLPLQHVSEEMSPYIETDDSSKMMKDLGSWHYNYVFSAVWTIHFVSKFKGCLWILRTRTLSIWFFFRYSSSSF